LKTLAYTIEPSGEALAINCSNNQGINSADLADLLRFLYYGEACNYLNICWDLDSTIVPLLRLLGKERCIKLHKTNKCFYRPYSIFYIPAKLLSVKTVFSKDKANYYDISQYFPDREPPKGVEGVARLGEELLEALDKMGLQPNKLTSPVAIWEQQVMNHLSLPTAWDMPKEAAEYAWRCSGKLWIEAYQIGYWK
jgi:hypothetical protein